MRAQEMKVVVFYKENGEVAHVAFSKDSGGVYLSVPMAYAETDEKRREVTTANAVLSGSSLPEEKTTEDTHYCRAISVAQGLALMAEELSNPENAQIFERSELPTTALCFVNNGPNGLQIAFSRDAAQKWYDPDQATPSSFPANPAVVSVARRIIDHTLLPIPKEEAYLDGLVGKPHKTGR